MRLSLRYRLWYFLEAATVGILFCVPPLVLQSIIHEGNSFFKLIPGLIIAWVLLTVFITNTPRGAKTINVQVGLAGTSALWLFFANSADVTGTTLVKYGVAGIFFAMVWFFRGKDPKQEKSWLDAILIIAVICLHWFFLFQTQNFTSRLNSVLWITIASVVNLWGVGVLAWKPNHRKVVRQLAWTLLASLAWVAPFVWLGDRAEPTLTLPLTGWLAAIACTFVVVIAQTPLDGIANNLLARPRIFQHQLARAQMLFNGMKFAPAIHPLRDAGWAWTENSGDAVSGMAGIKRMLAYSLDQTGKRPEAAQIAREITDNLIQTFIMGNLFSQQVSLTLLSLSGEQKNFFRAIPANSFHVMWQALAQREPTLQALARNFVQSALPDSVPILVAGFQKGDLATQRNMLAFLHDLGQTQNLLSQKESYPNLFNAFESADAKTRSLAHTVILKGGGRASPFLLAGLDQKSASTREFVMFRLIDLNKFSEVLEHIKRTIPTMEPKIVLTLLRALVERISPDQWASLADHITRLGNPHGLDILAKLQNSPPHSERITSAWAAIFPSLRHQLQHIIWSDVLENARQAAELRLRLNPHFIRNAARMLATGIFEEKRYAANLAARIAFLLPSGSPMVVAKRHKPEAEGEFSVQVQIAYKNGRRSLPIPMIHMGTGNTTLLFVNHEKYQLKVSVSPHVELSTRLHFIVNTDDIPIQPSLHNTFDPSQVNPSRTLEFQATPDDEHAFADRLTVDMYIQGRDQRLMAYDVFVCDPVVLTGLKA